MEPGGPICVCVSVCVFFLFSSLVAFVVQDKEKRTSFKGSLISLDTRCNMATEMVKVVVQQKVSPVEIAFKVRCKRHRGRYMYRFHRQSIG